MALDELIEAREAARSGEQFRTVLTGVFAAIEHNATSDNDYGLGEALRNALTTGKVVDPEALAQQFVKQLVREARKSGLQGSSFSSDLGDDWWLLPEDLRNRLDDGQHYLAWARAEQRSDYGPVIVSITSCVERLFDRLVIAPLASEANRLGVKTPWKTPFALGGTAFALGLRSGTGQHRSDLGYVALVDGWRLTLPTRVQSYLNLHWLSAINPLIDARNSWAHGKSLVTSAELEPLVAEAIGGRGSLTILGCLLEIQCRDGIESQDGVTGESQSLRVRFLRGLD